MRTLIAIALAAVPLPAMAQDHGSFVSLTNTDFIVLLAFLVFLGVLVYFGVPGQLTTMLDRRAAGIKAELDEARSLREEAQALVASYERKQKEVQAQAERIVSDARAEAERAAEAAKADIARSVERRLASAEEQIDAAQAAAVRQVRDRAIAVAIEAAREVIAREMSGSDAERLIDGAIEEVAQKLH